MILKLNSDNLGSYGTLFVGEHTKVPCLYASSVDIVSNRPRGCYTSHNKFGADLGNNMDDLGNNRIMDLAFSDSLGWRAPNRKSLAWFEKESQRMLSSWENPNGKWETTQYSPVALDDLVWTNAWLMKTDREDEPNDTHVRDHAFLAQMRGHLKYHVEGENAPIDFSPQLGFSFDYIWRLPRFPGDLRRIPLINTEIESTSVPMYSSERSNIRSTTFRMHCADGPLRFRIAKHLSDIYDGSHYNLVTERIVNSHGGSPYQRMLLAKHVLKSMEKFHLSRKRVFEAFDVQYSEVYPKGAQAMTYDDPYLLENDYEEQFDIWDPDKYQMFGEPYLTGQVDVPDRDKFDELFPKLKQVFADIDELYEHVTSIKQLLDIPTDYWEGKDPDRKMAALRHAGAGCYKKLGMFVTGMKELTDCGREMANYLSLATWSSESNHMIDYKLMVRLGILPRLPRLATNNRYDQHEMTWFSSWKMRVTPCCCFVMSQDRHDRAFARLEKALGYEIDREAFEQDLQNSLKGRQNRIAVIVGGIAEFIPRKRENIVKSLQNVYGKQVEFL